MSSEPTHFGGYEYTKIEASSVCAAKGKKLCKQKDLLHLDICSCGWTDDVSTPGYPMANVNAAPASCGGTNGGQVWRDCGPSDGLNADGTIKNGRPGQRPDGQRHASTFCCDADGDGDISNMLENIENLQATEQDLINRLDAYTSEHGYVSTDPKLIAMMNNINNIADSRIALFQSISTNADILQTGVSQSRIDLVAQLTLLQVVEDQLNQAKAKIDELQNTNDTKMRMVQINTYYGQRYEAQSHVMKKIIMICIPVLIIFILKKKSLIPETISGYLIGIIIAGGAFWIMFDVWDIYNRNNMDFDQIEFQYDDPASMTPSIWEYNKTHMFDFNNLLKNLMANLGLCVSDSCCADGTKYDSNKNKCMPITNNRQGFTTAGGLNGSVIASYPTDATGGGIMPYTEPFNYSSI